MVSKLKAMPMKARRGPRGPSVHDAALPVLLLCCILTAVIFVIGIQTVYLAAPTAPNRAPARAMRAMLEVPAPNPLDNATCSRVLWLSGLQAVTSKGGESHYLDSSTSYMRYYASALRSARARAPSLVPVLIFFNEPPSNFLEWVEAQGCIVIKHTISFQPRIARAVMADPNHPKLAMIDHLTASYARLDVPAIMKQVTMELEARRVGGVDTEYVLWTDPDVLFEDNIDGCSLPRPRLVSIGAETIPGTVANCGVMYFNVAAFEDTQPSLLNYADEHQWMFDDDQDLFRHFYQRWMITALPDAFNYKPYWGSHEFLRPAPMYKEQALAEVVIVHTHGPKPEKALCVIDFINENQIPVREDRDSILPHLQTVIDKCQLAGMPWLDVLVRLIASCAAADGGQLYRRVQELHNSLCPGQCWAQEAVSK